MKTVYTPLFFATICLTLILSSCQSTIEITKRKYNPGYYVRFFSESNNKSAESFTLRSTDVKSAKEQPALLPYHDVTMETFSMAEDKIVNCSKEVSPSFTRSKNLTPLVNVEKPASMAKEIKKMGDHHLKRTQKLNHLSLPMSPLDEIAMVLLIILAFIFPPLAVGLASDWDVTKLLISILLSIFFWVPGVIYALFVVLTGA